MAARNVVTKVVGKILTITVDLSKEGPLSASEKTHVIATTGGFMDVGDNVKIGLNVTTPAKKK
jgi:hypothetical protein